MVLNCLLFQSRVFSVWLIGLTNWYGNFSGFKPKTSRLQLHFSMSAGLPLLGTVYQTRFASMGLVKCQIVSDNKMPFSIFPIYHALLIDLAKNDSPLNVS